MQRQTCRPVMQFFMGGENGESSYSYSYTMPELDKIQIAASNRRSSQHLEVRHGLIESAATTIGNLHAWKEPTSRLSTYLGT